MVPDRSIAGCAGEWSKAAPALVGEARMVVYARPGGDRGAAVRLDCDVGDGHPVRDGDGVMGNGTGGRGVSQAGNVGVLKE